MEGLSSDARILFINISHLQECKAIGIMQKPGHVLLPDVVEQDGGRAFLYKPGLSRGAERVIVDVQLILVVDGIEIVDKKVFYFILPDDTVGSVDGILFVVVDIYIDRLLIGVAEAKCVESGSIAGQHIGRQFDLEKQGREGFFIFLWNDMRCECVYDGVGEHRQVVDGCMGLSFAVMGEDNGDQQKEDLFNCSVFF